MANDEWCTPSWLIESVREFYDGAIDLDPATCAPAQEMVRAKVYYYYYNGQTTPWFGNVWCNPPYSRGVIAEFADHAIAEASRTSQILFLTNACAGASWWQRLLLNADSVLFFDKRIAFIDPNGEPMRGNNHGQSLFYFGKYKENFKTRFEKFGVVMNRQKGSDF